VKIKIDTVLSVYGETEFDARRLVGNKPVYAILRELDDIENQGRHADDNHLRLSAVAEGREVVCYASRCKSGFSVEKWQVFGKR
jgi:hypothetical protein